MESSVQMIGGHYLSAMLMHPQEASCREGKDHISFRMMRLLSCALLRWAVEMRPCVQLLVRPWHQRSEIKKELDSPLQ